MKYRLIVLGLISAFMASTAMAELCVDCHKKLTPEYRQRLATEQTRQEQNRLYGLPWRSAQDCE